MTTRTVPSNIVGLVEHLDQFGFLVLPELADRELVERAANRVLGLMNEHGDPGKPVSHLRDLLGLLQPEELRPFEELLTHPLLMGLVETVLGKESQMAEVGARWLYPGSEGLPLHVGFPSDQISQDGLRIPSTCFVLTFSWLLSDMTLDNAPRLFVPCSQHLGCVPSEGLESIYAVRVTAPAGSLIAFNSSTWHGFDPNRGANPQGRIELCSAYTVPWLDPGKAGWKMIHPSVVEHCSEAIRRVNRRSMRG